MLTEVDALIVRLGAQIAALEHALRKAEAARDTAEEKLRETSKGQK